MAKAVIKGASYTLVHAPDLLKRYGSTQAAVLEKNPDDPYIKAIPQYLRSFEEVVNYPPNQVYIGNMHPEALEGIEQPWYKNAKPAERYGAYGEIMTQAEFYTLIKHSDVFELVLFTKEFTKEAKSLIANHPLLKEQGIDLGEGSDSDEIKKFVEAHTAEGLYENDRLVGCVKQAHDTDENLSGHIMLENLATKASGVLAALHMGKLKGIDMASVDYIIECSEEAVGDVNQRGGGNMAKSVGERSHCANASGSDLRAFCAAPVHAMVNASALVSSGIFKNVLVVGGGSIPKLGMNGKDHVKKEMPLLEDAMGSFAVLVGEDDGVNPVINTNVIGKHTISSGSSPQAVMSALIYDPLNKGGMNITDVDRYAAELQNHEITVPAGAGNVPEANVKMVGALAVMKKQLEKSSLLSFVKEHGVIGFAPTQGHIPSGVPFVGHARDAMISGKLKNTMIVGKGSLFLGRLTNLFDGLSFLIEANDGAGSTDSADAAGIKKIVAEAMRDVAENLLAKE